MTTPRKDGYEDVPPSICGSCGFDGDYHSDEGKCMNAHSRAMIRAALRQKEE